MNPSELLITNDADGCPLCDIVTDISDSSVVIEVDGSYWFLDKYPTTRGHALLIPKRHFQSLHELESIRLYKFLEESTAEIRY